MSIKSAIYAANTTSGQAIANGGIYAPTTVVRKYGSCAALASNGVKLSQPGYYEVSAVATVAATAAGEITATLYQDGVAIPGATATASAAADDVVTLPLAAIVKTCCGCLNNVVTVVISGQATTSNNLAIVTEKI